MNRFILIAFAVIISASTITFIHSWQDESIEPTYWNGLYYLP